jgi:hypothetical protein
MRLAVASESFVVPGPGVSSTSSNMGFGIPTDCCSCTMADLAVVKVEPEVAFEFPAALAGLGPAVVAFVGTIEFPVGVSVVVAFLGTIQLTVGVSVVVAFLGTV